MLKICPKCKGIAAYDPYFQAHICLTHSCTWMDEPNYKEEPVKKFTLKRVNPKYSEVLALK